MIESELSKTTQLSTPFGGMAELCLDTGTVFRDAEKLCFSDILFKTHCGYAAATEPAAAAQPRELGP